MVEYFWAQHSDDVVFGLMGSSAEEVICKANNE